MHPTLPLLAQADSPPIGRRTLETPQVNLGYRCSPGCVHGPVAAGPQRTEMMDGDTAALVLEVLRARRVSTLDLTGGAPELNPHFRGLARQAGALGVRVIDRCKLTILSEPGHEDLAAFLAGQDRPHLRDLLRHDATGSPIRVADPCCGCTAGPGSRCGGALEPTAEAAAAAETA
jgi:hypothetical protein